MAHIDIFIGTVFGGAEAVAEALNDELISNGHTVSLHNPGTIAEVQGSSNIIICTSTTGTGDIPDGLVELYFELKESFPLIPETSFAVVGLGDSSYGATFCYAGFRFDELLEELTGKRVMEYFRIDAMETFEPEEDALVWLKDYMQQLDKL
ncbi:MAG: flavodoxin [Methylococcales bacterium]